MKIIVAATTGTQFNATAQVMSGHMAVTFIMRSDLGNVRTTHLPDRRLRVWRERAWTPWERCWP